MDIIDETIKSTTETSSENEDIIKTVHTKKKPHTWPTRRNMWLKLFFCQGHQVVSISKGFDTHFRSIKIVWFSWEVLIREHPFFCALSMCGFLWRRSRPVSLSVRIITRCSGIPDFSTDFLEVWSGQTTMYLLTHSDANFRYFVQ